MNLVEKFKEYVSANHLFQPNDRLLLAVSGGVDSVALCELCNKCGYGFAIAHCNFKLRGDASDADEVFVKSLAEKYGVVFYNKEFETKGYASSRKQSIEEAARELRYNWFNELISAESDHPFRYILTGHHADDNIETVIINFFRGTGISGLRGILPKQGKIIRPLLFARRSELEEFIKANGLSHITDHTNFENEFTRNHFRNAIIPLVNKNFPGADNNILKNIQRFSETELLYKQAIQIHKKKLLHRQGAEVHIPVLKLQKTQPLATVIFEIIREYGFTAHQTEEAIALIESESGKYIKSSSHRLLKNRNWLIISPLQAIEASSILVEENDIEIIFGHGVLKMKRMEVGACKLSNEHRVAMLDAKEISFPLLLRKWKQGDYFYPLGMQKKKKLSRFFIDQKLSIFEKENVVVLESNKKIIWVVGKRIDDRFKITAATQKVLHLHYLPK